MNPRELLTEYLERHEAARWFDYEEDKMFSNTEHELLGQHPRKYGEMPGGVGEEDDLF